MRAPPTVAVPYRSRPVDQAPFPSTIGCHPAAMRDFVEDPVDEVDGHLVRRCAVISVQAKRISNSEP
jgi:hypothetical protein